MTHLPNADLIGAMTRVGGYGRFFGYLDKVDGKLAIASGAKYDRMVGNAEGTDTVNQQVFQYRNVLQAVLDDPDFKDKKCDQAETHCLYAVWQIYG